MCSLHVMWLHCWDMEDDEQNTKTTLACRTLFDDFKKEIINTNTFATLVGWLPSKKGGKINNLVILRL